MAELGLLDVQMAEILDAIRITLSAIAFMVGATAWTWATYFMKEEGDK